VVEVEFDFELGRGKLIGGLCAAELLNDAVGFFGDFFQDFSERLYMLCYDFAS